MSISKTEAAAILNCQTAEEAEEAYEQKLFEWKQKYLMHIPPIKLILAHIQKIERLNAAGSHFINIESLPINDYERIDLNSSLAVYLERYQAQILSLKLAISTTENGKVLVRLLMKLVEIQKHLLNKLVIYSPANAVHHLSNVKISDSSDFYAVQKELKEKDIPETEIMNYLSSELKFGSYPFNSFLLNEVLKSLKQKD